MPGINYINAESVNNVIEALKNNRGKSKVIAGATDLMLEYRRGDHQGVETFIDISRIPNLNRIVLDGEGIIHLGAMVTHNDCVASHLLKQFALPLVQACWEVGSPQIRNRGTVVGNLVTGSPANDTITPLMALEAQLRLVSYRGERIVKLSEFYRGVRSTVLEPDELVLEIIFKALKPAQKGTFIKFALRQAQAISVVNTAIVLSFSGNIISDASITLGAVAPTIIHAPFAENFLRGKSLEDPIIREAAMLAANSAKPISDLRASAEYRKWIVMVIIRRALEAIKLDDVSGKLIDQPALLNMPVQTAPQVSLSNPLKTTVNGKSYAINIDRFKSLLDLLRENMGLTGTKEGCAEGECGACTAHLDGAAVMSCLVPAHRAYGAEIMTIEGVGSDDRLHAVQQAFVENGAVQCGYCTPGLIMSSIKLLEEYRHPNKNQITHALTGNLCRCTGYYKVIEAVEKAATGGL